MRKKKPSDNIIWFPIQSTRPVYPKGHIFSGFTIPTLKEISAGAKKAASRWK